MNGVFKLIVRTCVHPNTSERPKYAIDDPPGHYLCLDCGSKFPLIGNTLLWADGLTAEVEPL